MSILSVFANPVRLKLILYLAITDQPVSDLIKQCKLSQSAVSQHLEKLRSAGIVTTNRDGKEIVYRLAQPDAAEIAEDLLAFIR